MRIELDAWSGQKCESNRLTLRMSKIFGIGFHKTGTSSLAHALRTLGFRVTGPNGVHNPNIADEALTLCLRVARNYDAFQDNPWPILYKEMDAHFPGSKFILTLRDTGEWLQSAKSHFGRRTTPMRNWIYGVNDGPKGNEAIYRERYERHNREVMEYFVSRRQDLLILRITEGGGWEELCAFLEKPVPESPFPHVNTRGKRGK